MRDRLFAAALGLGLTLAPHAAAQDDVDAGPPAESPDTPAEPPPPAPPPEPPPPPAEEPIELPEEPPPPPPSKPPPKPQPKQPPRAALPPAPPQPPPAAKEPARRSPAPAPAPTPRTAPRSTTAPTANAEAEPKANAGGDEETKPKEDADEDDTDGLFGPFRIGGLVGVGLPSVLSFGGAIKLTRYLGGGLNIGLIPTIRISLYGEAKISYQEYDIYGRIFPFGGMFFIGAGVGYATITGSFKSSYDVRPYQAIAPSLPDTLAVESKASVRTLVLTPQIGLQHTFGSGFTLGIDGGVQVPLAPSEIDFSTQVPPNVPPEVIQKYVEPNDQKVRDTLETIGRAVVPTLNLRAGWLL